MLNRFNPSVAIFTIIFETLFIVIIVLHIFVTPDISHLKKFLPLANVIIVVLSVLVLISIRQIEASSKKEAESQLLKEHLQNVEDLVSSLNTQRHEHTRHIQTIQAMLYLEEIEEAKEYLEGIADNYRVIQDLIYVGNPALTALLNSKRKVAEVRGINFDFSVKCNIENLDILPWDLCSIIGNLLDNALEAAVEKNVDKRVALEIKYEDNNYFVFYVYNNGAKIPDSRKNMIFAPGYTTKNSAGRGWGLYLVKKLVDKYGGTIEVINQPRTTFIVKLPDRRFNHVANSINENCPRSGLTTAQ